MKIFVEINNNLLLEQIGFTHGITTLEGNIFGMLDQFFKNNHKLNKFVVEDCELGTHDVRHLSVALGSCNKSLKCICVKDNEIGDGQQVEILLALSMHPQLEKIDLSRMNVGRNECTALATLLHNTTKQLQTLNLDGNNIDDEGVETLVHVIAESKLRDLDLSCNRSITAIGWKKVSTLLERPDSNLEKLYLSRNNIGNEGGLIFANAMVDNHKLQTLSLTGNGFTDEGWAHFTRLLCGTSSVNKTYLSNHTLQELSFVRSSPMPADVQLYLRLNRSSKDKGLIAMIKILQHQSHFNVQPFFEWELKALPLIISWLEKANACTPALMRAANVSTDGFEDRISRMKLSCMYDFVREFPMLYVEPVTRKEIEECSDMEEQLLGDEMQHAMLEEVQQRKTRAIRRLF